jgi:hypothetical protein
MSYAVVFWDGIGWFWAEENSTERHGPFTERDALDDAITDAKAHGFKIGNVRYTRGLLPAWRPPAARTLSGEHKA